MTTRSSLATAIMVAACLQAGPLFAQSAPAPDTAAAPAPAASPAASTAPTDKAGANDGKSAGEEPAKPNAKPKAKKFSIHMSAQTRQQIDHAIKTRTVPSRYRSQVPKEYQKYIPFER